MSRCCRPRPTAYVWLDAVQVQCADCGCLMWVSHYASRTITTLTGQYGLKLAIRWCCTRNCSQYHRPYRPEAEGSWALPHGEFGLDVIALVGTLRFREHRSVPEIHAALVARGLQLAERTVLNLLHRYEELVTLHLANHVRLRACLQAQGKALLAIDGLQPDVGHEVLWVIRECLAGEILLARPLLSGSEVALATLLREVQDVLPVPVRGLISDGQRSLRKAVAAVFPDIPHQLCHFHYLREAAKPVYEADRHAKKELKKQVRGVRSLERAVEWQEDGEAQVTRAYCLAVRSALADDGRPPLCASGLTLHERLTHIATSLERVAQKGGSLHHWSDSGGFYRKA